MECSLCCNYKARKNRKTFAVGFPITCLWKVRNKGLPWVSGWDSRLMSSSCLWETSPSNQSLDPIFCFLFVYRQYYFFHHIALHLNFFMKIKLSWRDLFFHPSSHKNEIVHTVQVSVVTRPYVKGSTVGWDTDSLGQLPSLPSWDLESSFSVSLLLWHDNIINL